MESDLLDKIVCLLQKQYLSDLHSISSEELISAIKSINTCSYSVSQWNYTLSYILGSDVHMKDISEIYSFL